MMVDVFKSLYWRRGNQLYLLGMKGRKNTHWTDNSRFTAQYYLVVFYRVLFFWVKAKFINDSKSPRHNQSAILRFFECTGELH